MSSRTAAARKRLQEPLPRVPPSEQSIRPFASTTRARSASTPLPFITNLTHTITAVHESTAYPERLDLSNEFPQPLAPEYSRTYSPYPQSNYPGSEKIGSSQAIQVISACGPKSPRDDIRKSLYLPSQLDQRHDLTYQTPFSLPNPKLHSSKRALPAKILLSYAEQPDLPFPPSYPPPSPPRYLPDHSAATPHMSPSSSPPFRSNRHSPTPTDLPEYCSTYSSYDRDSHIGRQSFQNNARNLPVGDNQSHRYQHLSSSSSGLAPPIQITLSPIQSERRLNCRRFPGVRTSFNSSMSSVTSPVDSASVSGSSGYSFSTTAGSQPPAPPPSPNFVFPGSRSIARPKLSPKTTNSQFKLRSKSKLRLGKGPRGSSSDIPPFPISSVAFETPGSPLIVQGRIQPNYPECLLDSESIVVLSEDYERMNAYKIRQAPGKEPFIFPTSRSRAQPKSSKSSSGPRPSKNFNYSSTSTDANHPGGRSRIMEIMFKKKQKVKAPNLTSEPNYIISDFEASSTEHTREEAFSSEANSRFTGRQEKMRRVKSKSGSYPLDPYNSVLLDNDRHTGELLSRLNSTGSPSFHNYRNAPPSSVLDLGCGQGHWVLEAAVAWKEYGTLVTGYDMVDISRNMLFWAAEHGLQKNIRFVRGNFLKQQLPFGSGTFDLVRMSCLALCIPSDSWDFVLQEVCRVLMAGGRLELIDDQMFFPYGKVSSLMNDTDSIVELVPPKLDIVVSPTVTTFSIYGDLVANPGLGSTLGHGDEDESLHKDETATPHCHKGKTQISPVQPHFNITPALSPEVWNRAQLISEDLEVLFENMLLEKFDIQKGPSEFILPLMKWVFGQARELKTMHLVLAPPDPTAQLVYPPQGLSDYPGLILWPSTFLPMHHTEIEIHASKHLHTLLSCKNFLSQHSVEKAEDKRVDEDFISEALWEYEGFLQHRFNPPLPSGDDDGSETDSIHGSIAESTNSDSREAMLELQSEFRQRFTWQPERDPPPNTTFDDLEKIPVITKSPPASSLPGSSLGTSVVPSNEITHVRTFRVYEAIKVDNYIFSSDTTP